MSLRTLLRKSGENHIPSASVRLGATFPSYQMTLFSFHNRSLFFSSDFVMLFTISSTSSSIKIVAIILRPKAGKGLLAASRFSTKPQNQQNKHTVLEAKVHCCSRQNRASVNSNSDWLSAIFSNLTVAPAKICLLKSIADVRSIAVISGPLLLGMSAFVSTDRTKVKIKKSGLPNMHSPSQYFLTSKLGVGVGGIELRFNSEKQHITKDEMNLRKKGL